MGFYKLRKFLEEAYKRIDAGKSLNFKTIINISPAFKTHIKESLNLSDEEFKGYALALHYFNLVRKDGTLRRIDNPKELRNLILSYRPFLDTLRNLYDLAMRSYKIPASLEGIYAREIAKKVIKKVPGLQVSTALGRVILDIARSFIPFVTIPARYTPDKRELTAVTTSLIELGGIAEIQEVFDRAVSLGRLGKPEEFVYGLSYGVMIEENIGIRVEHKATEIAKKALLALAWRIRAVENYQDTSPSRVSEFINWLKNYGKDRIFLEVGYKKEILDREILSIIDESVAKNAEDFLSAYGSVRVALIEIKSKINLYEPPRK